MARMLKHIDCFLSPSRFTLQKHLDEGLDIPIKQMPYFLPEKAESDDVSVETPPEQPYFLFVGRLEYIKGVQNLIPVFKNLPQYNLLIAGDGEYRKALEAQAGNTPNIQFLGRLEQSRLQELYRSATTVIVPSICYETFGIIIIEAFSHKTPVIVNDLGALPEVVDDSGGGFTYRNQDELVAAIIKLAENALLRNELGKKGYAAYLRYWNEDAHLERYMKVIEGVKREKKKTVQQLGPVLKPV